MMLKEEI